ncbi:universal stress protein [Kitasatospora phosalacinea]|uniref:Universal stress protein n=1 Tax=Kitasatospora phosalacinea TaxID=2065 RepID=A0A9W6QBJ3_9ACTN|nr:universal stress protein [Kitasatospora phosalacinea]GLW73420.1 universal stress protein [Kitasatospora phosalacinea]
MGTENEGPARIVAGVDGSPSSRAALAWAVRQAELTGAAVDAVTAWQYPAGYGWPAPVLQSFDFAAAAGQALAEAVEAVATRHGGVEIRQRVVQDHPATALLAAADGAELLVVGNRGRGGFAGTLLGSVSQHCVHHARCPVVVVRTD